MKAKPHPLAVKGGDAMLEALGFLQSVITGVVAALIYDLAKAAIRRIRRK